MFRTRCINGSEAGLERFPLESTNGNECEERYARTHAYGKHSRKVEVPSGAVRVRILFYGLCGVVRFN